MPHARFAPWLLAAALTHGCASPSGASAPAPAAPAAVGTTDVIAASMSMPPPPSASAGQPAPPAQPVRSATSPRGAGDAERASLLPPGSSSKPAEPPPEERALAALRGRFRQCFNQELQRNPDASSTVGKWTLVLDAEGVVTAAKFGCSNVSKPLQRCLEESVKRLSLGGGPQTLTVGSCPPG